MSKRVIRQGAFETNSSSEHTICWMNHISDDAPEWDDIYLDRNGVWQMRDSEDMYFGRYPFRILTTPGEKAMYAIAALVQDKSDPEYKEIFETVKKIHPELKDISFKIETTSFYHDPDDLEKVKQWYGDRYKCFGGRIITWDYDTGMVDEDILGPFLKKFNVSLEEFILKRNIIVVCDGDEYEQFKGAKRAGLIDIANIIAEFPDRRKSGWWKELKQAGESQG